MPFADAVWLSAVCGCRLICAPDAVWMPFGEMPFGCRLVAAMPFGSAVRILTEMPFRCR